MYLTSVKGFKKLMIVGKGTDIAVITCYHFYDININELWVEYDVGQYLSGVLRKLNMQSFGVFDVSSQVVMQCSRSVVEVKRHHEMSGVPLTKLHEFYCSKPVCFS